jgi:hypothetical protein
MKCTKCGTSKTKKTHICEKCGKVFCKNCIAEVSNGNIHYYCQECINKFKLLKVS